MSELVCTGLREEHFPLAALAAYGLLHVCSEDLHISAVRLSWQQLPQWTAVLHAPNGSLLDELPERLATWCSSSIVVQDDDRSAWWTLPPGFPWSTPLDMFAVEFRIAATLSTSAKRRRTDSLVALGTELVASKKNVVPSPLCMPTSGRFPWVQQVRNLEEVLAGSCEAAQNAFAEALLGPWRYGDVQSSFGLDPSTIRLHAYGAQAPAVAGTAAGVRAGVWLAIQSLPLFPCAPEQQRVSTAGVAPAPDRRAALFLPVWMDPIGVDALRSMLCLPFSDDQTTLKALEHRGVSAVFRSSRNPMGDRGIHALGPSTVCAG